jgi:Ran GTPase-activating protein (RanGAP) involved in mRNA processing and transport
VDALVGIKHAPFLAKLHIDFGQWSVQWIGASLLVQLSELRSLRELRLGLANTDIDDLGVESLVALMRSARGLNFLRLDLQDNEYMTKDTTAILMRCFWVSVPVGGRRVGWQDDRPPLHTLKLDLGHNHQIEPGPNRFGPREGGVGELQHLFRIPLLHTLDLSLHSMLLDDDSIARLMPQTHTELSVLQTLKLDLSSNSFHRAGTATLAASVVYRMPHLTELRLDLSHMYLPDSHAKYLSNRYLNNLGEFVEGLMGIHQAPRLQILDLNLSGNDIGSRGATALGVHLRRAPALHTLKLILQDNDIGVEGAEGLALLKHTPLLRELYIDMHGNNITNTGAQWLAGLYGGEDGTNPGTALRKLFLGLSGNKLADCESTFVALKNTNNLHFEYDC